MRARHRKEPGAGEKVVRRIGRGMKRAGKALAKEIKDKTDRKRAAGQQVADEKIPSVRAKRKVEKMRETEAAGLKRGGRPKKGKVYVTDIPKKK